MYPLIIHNWFLLNCSLIIPGFIDPNCLATFKPLDLRWQVWLRWKNVYVFAHHCLIQHKQICGYLLPNLVNPFTNFENRLGIELRESGKELHGSQKGQKVIQSKVLFNYLDLDGTVSLFWLVFCIRFIGWWRPFFWYCITYCFVIIFFDKRLWLLSFLSLLNLGLLRILWLLLLDFFRNLLFLLLRYLIHISPIHLLIHILIRIRALWYLLLSLFLLILPPGCLSLSFNRPLKHINIFSYVFTVLKPRKYGHN